MRKCVHIGYRDGIGLFFGMGSFCTITKETEPDAPFWNECNKCALYEPRCIYAGGAGPFGGNGRWFRCNCEALNPYVSMSLFEKYCNGTDTTCPELRLAKD
ncbi:MAG: hypothetical protein FWE09_05910 [Treponema sp.]|nr:hypothetical protein [Treponema sp.]